ncbi:MAG: chromosome partitioning protein ParB, partial [Azonexus sp.]|nr:chromosome partitioning protein ParB [Azonexus sp.]
GRHFKWNTEFLELFTLSELESLAGEVGLKAKMGAVFKLARAKKKGDFIKSLLAVPGFAYEGTLPVVMQYPRRAVSAASIVQANDDLAVSAVESAEEALAA